MHQRYTNRQNTALSQKTIDLMNQRMADVVADIEAREEKLKSKLAQSVGSQIKERRKAKGLTQAKLAEMAGVSTNALSDLENGAGNPSIALIEAIAAALGCRTEVNLIRLKEPSK